MQTQRPFLKRKTDPVNILPNLSKVYERCMYIQIYEYVNKILSKWQCGFCQGYSAQHCLLVMVEKWRQCLDNGGVSAVCLQIYLKLSTVYYMTF